MKQVTFDVDSEDHFIEMIEWINANTSTNFSLPYVLNIFRDQYNVYYRSYFSLTFFKDDDALMFKMRWT